MFSPWAPKHALVCIIQEITRDCMCFWPKMYDVWLIFHILFDHSMLGTYILNHCPGVIIWQISCKQKEGAIDKTCLLNMSYFWAFRVPNLICLPLESAPSRTTYTGTKQAMYVKRHDASLATIMATRKPTRGYWGMSMPGSKANCSL